MWPNRDPSLLAVCCKHTSSERIPFVNPNAQVYPSINPRSTRKFSTSSCMSSLFGVSRIIGTSAKRESLRMKPKAPDRAVRSPHDHAGQRATQPFLLSLKWKHLSRSSPRMRSNSLIVAA